MTVLDRVPVEAIAARAAQMHPGRTLLNLIAGLLWLLGWAPTKAVKMAWIAAVWCAAAVAEGASEAWREPGEGNQ